MTKGEAMCKCGHGVSDHNEFGCIRNVYPRQGDEPTVTYPPEMLPQNDEDYEAEVIVIQFCECFGFTALGSNRR